MSLLPSLVFTVAVLCIQSSLSHAALCCPAAKSVRSMAQGGRGLPHESGGDPLDLLDAGNSRRMVKHAAAHNVKRPKPDSDDEDFMQDDTGKMIVRVSAQAFRVYDLAM